ncbi:MAG: hypothetical protein M1831_000078 [Alyxoria varia]|nr:MAG: hypothetical protein M1831_000078 [Alyxoria varia]
MDREDYKVAIVCALPCEVEACRLSLDQVHDALRLSPNSTRKNYILGSIGSQNVVIASLPHGNYGPLSAATVSAQLEYDFTSIESRLLVGVAGGVPDLNRSSPQDIRLGDVVVSTPTKKSPGVVTHDSGTIVQAPQGQVFQRTGTSNQPPQNLLMIVTTLRGSQAALQQSMAAHINQIREVSEDFRNIPRPDEMQDNLIDSGYIHKDSGSRCDKDCERHRIHRDERKRTSHMSSTVQRSCGALCFDMEAGGVMNNRQYLIIRGIADYADSHKNKDWQPYAAATAAAYAKELILAMAPSAQQKTQGGAQEPPTPAAPTIHGAQNQNNYGGQNLTGSFKHVSFGVMGTQAHPPVAQPPQPLFPCASCRTELPWESPIVTAASAGSPCTNVNTRILASAERINLRSTVISKEYAAQGAVAKTPSAVIA